MISAGTRPRTLHYGSPGGKRHGKRKPLNNLPSKGKKGPLSIKQTWSDRAHMGLPEHVGKYHPELNWTELGSGQACVLPGPKHLQSEKHYSSLNLAESNEALAIKIKLIDAGIKQNKNMQALCTVSSKTKSYLLWLNKVTPRWRLAPFLSHSLWTITTFHSNTQTYPNTAGAWPASNCPHVGQLGTCQNDRHWQKTFNQYTSSYCFSSEEVYWLKVFCQAPGRVVLYSTSFM